MKSTKQTTNNLPKGRPIKFRAWDGKKMLFRADLMLSMDGKLLTDGTTTWRVGSENDNPFASGFELMQYTGLKDKNEPSIEVYEGDIIDEQGKVIGNRFETPDLLKNPANLFIQQIGTGDWCYTYQKAVARGYKDA